MTDVFLINCPIAFGKNGEMLGDETTNPPLGLLYIASYLEKSGISVKAYDVRAQNLSLRNILGKIKKEKPKVVGLSAMTPSIRAAVELAKEIRGKFGHTEPVIALGGAHICADPDFIKRFPVFDFGVDVNQFSIFSIKKLLKASGFEVIKVQNLEIFLPYLFTLFTGLLKIERRKLRVFEKIDQWLVRLTPSFLASNWLILCQKK